MTITASPVTSPPHTSPHPEDTPMEVAAAAAAIRARRPDLTDDDAVTLTVEVLSVVSTYADADPDSTASRLAGAAVEAARLRSILERDVLPNVDDTVAARVRDGLDGIDMFAGHSAVHG